ncbi:Dabb family protein [Nocardioides sp. CFH 31398]|uniref:Dabb family protein n=1 Tax=Nocardioides sp. CFH 31398 TaxID=2919579 RepID=UPI001F05B9D4|nr:Dabb family protein [Nocardioides sp. CFH 31398]MCH1865949.1 Dabb family protein [Nocardioides sp. CFH 31398]
MIRNVVVGVVKDGVPSEQVEVALQALRDLTLDGEPLGIVAGRDLGLREGNASYSLTVDFADEDAYRRYDLDEEHNRIRRELFAPISSEIRRIQFRLP